VGNNGQVAIAALKGKMTVSVVLPSKALGGATSDVAKRLILLLLDQL